MISLDGAQLLQQWDLFGWKRITAISKVASISRLSVEETGCCFEEGCHDVLRSTKRCPTKRQKAKCSCFDRSCCPLAVIDPNISAPRTKIDPKKATRQNRTQKGAPCNEIRPKIGAPHTVHQNRAQKRRATHQKWPQKVHRAPKSAHHTPCTKIEPKNGAPRTKIEPKNDAPCAEIGPKIGAPHTAHQNPAQKRRTAHQNPPQKRRTAHQNRARKGAPRTKIHPKRHHAPGPRPHIRQVSGSIPPRSSPILRAQKGAPCTEIGPKIGAPHTAHQNRAQKRRTAHQKRAQKRRTVHRNRPQNRRTTHRAPKSSSKTAHRAPKSSPKTAHRTPKPNPKRHTSHQNPPERASCARTKALYSSGLGLDSPQVLSNLARSCCPLAVIDPNISAPRTKIDP